MQIYKFRIQNYKSITDSGDCYPSNRVTIFAGKNEAGKSSILEALEDFNSNKAINEKAVSIKNRNKPPSIIITFKVDDIFWNEIIREISQDQNQIDYFTSQLCEIQELIIKKEYPEHYIFNEHIYKILFAYKLPNWSSLIEALEVSYKQIISRAILGADEYFKFDLNNIKKINNYQELKKIANQLLLFQNQTKDIIANLPQDEGLAARVNIQAFAETVVKQESIFNSLRDKFKSTILNRAPNFILFKSFEDIFPNSVPFSELTNNKWISDLVAMSDLNVTTLLSSSNSDKMRHKTHLNINLNKDFSSFWTQDKTKLSIDWDSSNLYFWIEEDGEYYTPEDRSQGRKWHLAFYIRIAARSRENLSNIILIDEPGLYLHATAQRDILKHLEKSSENCSIFITTHSPYLIEPNKLERIRLVQKTNEHGTQIENKIHAVSDKETLTPIMTAIGLELNQGIIGADKYNNVIVEGPSDYFYLTALGELLNQSSVKFVSGGSSGNMPKIGTILQGWGAKVIYLYDNDQAFGDAQKSIKKDWVTISKEWLISLKIDNAIEDIFTKSEFAEILSVDPNEITGRNSDYLKTNRRDKVLPARQFLESVRSNQKPFICEDTLIIARKLFSSFSEKFNTYKY